MCGRFTLRTPLGLLVEQFMLQHSLPFTPRYNIAPTQNVLAVRSEQGERSPVLLHWGLIPAWAKDTKIGYSTINARADTLATKPAFRTALKKRRCLIPADGYYEWLKEGKIKQPYLYEVDGGQPFAFAGLWEQWWGPNHQSSTPLESCTIITTEANDLARQVHDRMPVILDAVDYDVWLDPANQDAESLRYLFDPFPADRMTVRAVSTYVNNAKHEGVECLANPTSPSG